MKAPLGTLVFKITPVFHYIQGKAEQAGLHVHYEKAKETLQLFMNKESYVNGEKYIGAIQYEGSNNYGKREPHLVSWRFKRSNISVQLKQELELLTAFRKDKNTGPEINHEAESIAFKFEYLNEDAKKAIEEIVNVLQKYC